MIVFLTGYPGSGKGTQGKLLSQILGIPHISTGELFRNEAKTGSSIGNKMKEYMDVGQIIPNDIHFEYLRSTLAQHTNGYILDGYPKNKECLDFIMGEINGKIEPKVIHLKVNKDVAIERLSSRLFCEQCELSYPKTHTVCNKCNSLLVVRHDDTEKTIEKRISVFEENTRVLFKNAMIVDAEQSQERVLLDILIKIYPDVVYANTTVISIFHNHIDAKNKAIVEEINRKLEKYKSKIYTVDQLLLCSQVDEMQEIYNQLPNFHTIMPDDREGQEEAFSTSKMGASFNYEQQLETLAVTNSYKNQGVMTEVEEELIRFDRNSNTFPEFTLIRHSENNIDLSRFKEYRNIVESELFELHHAFEYPKTCETMPLSLEDLNKLTSSLGFKNGGWFIFKDPSRWLYRSNEFSNKNYTECLLLLVKQSTDLFNAIGQQPISSSLEKVHAIWPAGPTEPTEPTDKKIFVNSSNDNKFDEYKRYLSDYEVVRSSIDCKEPDSDSITIIRYKASLLPNGYITDDVSLNIDGTLIGTNIKLHVNTLEKYIGKRAVYDCFIGTKCDNVIKIYKGTVYGKIVAPVGTGFGFGPYFLPDNASTTLGDVMEPKYNARYIAVQNYLQDNIYAIQSVLYEWNGNFQ